MDLTSGGLIGPALVAAAVSALVAFVGMIVNRRTALTLHQERLVADRDLAERKVAADIALAEKKLSLDRGLADWKRRTELAEQILADFYKAKEIFTAARQPFARAGEGSTRPRMEHEDPGTASYRDAVYACFERLGKELDFLADLHSRRFRFMALFGRDCGQHFMVLVQTYNRVSIATSALLNDRRNLPTEQRLKYEALIGWVLEDTDPVVEEIDRAVQDIEHICRPVLSAVPQ